MEEMIPNPLVVGCFLCRLLAYSKNTESQMRNQRFEVVFVLALLEMEEAYRHHKKPVFGTDSSFLGLLLRVGANERWFS